MKIDLNKLSGQQVTVLCCALLVPAVFFVEFLAVLAGIYDPVRDDQLPPDLLRVWWAARVALCLVTIPPVIRAVLPPRVMEVSVTKQVSRNWLIQILAFVATFAVGSFLVHFAR